MKILLVGNGGREHALAWRMAQSSQITKVYVATGNAGTAIEHKVQNIPILPEDLSGLLAFAKKEKPALTVIGPEGPLAAGIVDQFLAEKLPCFGPTQAAAQIETSKIFCKNFLRRHGIPGANYAYFQEIGPAEAYLKNCFLPDCYQS